MWVWRHKHIYVISQNHRYFLGNFSLLFESWCDVIFTRLINDRHFDNNNGMGVGIAQSLA